MAEDPGVADPVAELVQLLSGLSEVSPAVAENAPLTWVPGVDNPAVQVGADTVELRVVCHRWPVEPLLRSLRERVSTVAQGRAVRVCCVDVVLDPAAPDRTPPHD